MGVLYLVCGGRTPQLMRDSLGSHQPNGNDSDVTDDHCDPQFWVRCNGLRSWISANALTHSNIVCSSTTRSRRHDRLRFYHSNGEACFTVARSRSHLSAAIDAQWN